MNDANGSMTADDSGRVFVYDAWNRLVSVRNTANSPIVEYELDALGRRIIEDRPNANTVDHLYYSTSWQVLEERRDGTSTGDVRRQYFWSVDYVDALTARVDYASGAVSATYHSQYDANWNVTAIADASTGILERYIYDPYGAATVLYANWSVRGGSPYGWNYLHQGGRLDIDSNLYHFRNRDYSATLGRWTQTDRIGFEADDTNLYRYVGNGPVVGVDPSGLFVEPPAQGMHPRNNEDPRLAPIIEPAVPVYRPEPPAQGMTPIHNESPRRIPVDGPRFGDLYYNYFYNSDDMDMDLWLGLKGAQYTAEICASSLGIGLISKAPRLIGLVRIGGSGSRLVKVTSWARMGTVPDLNSGRWVMLGKPTLWRYWMTGLPGGKFYPTMKWGVVPWVKWAPSNTSYSNCISGLVEQSRIMWPKGIDFIKGIIGQRILK